MNDASTDLPTGAWRASSRCGNGHCVELRVLADYAGPVTTAARLGPFRTSSYSLQGGCVALALGPFRTSSASSNNGSACVALALDAPHAARFAVRDSKRLAGGTLVLPDAARVGLLAFARAT